MKTEKNNTTCAKKDVVILPVCNCLYSCCKNLFENITAIELSYFLNARPIKIKVSARQAIRVCHLLYIISNELIEDGNKSGWVKSVLQNCGISEATYRSHYHEMGQSKDSDDVLLVRKIKAAIKRAKYYQIREMAESNPDYLEAIIKVAKEMG